jgi:purine-cytosine permease-like protein
MRAMFFSATTPIMALHGYLSYPPYVCIAKNIMLVLDAYLDLLLAILITSNLARRRSETVHPAYYYHQDRPMVSTFKSIDNFDNWAVSGTIRDQL